MSAQKAIAALLVLFLPFFFTSHAYSQKDVETVKVTADDRVDGRITIYNGNLAAVSDTRSIDVGGGKILLELADVSARIQSETALISGVPFTFIEQNFDYDLLTPSKLIEKAVGKTLLVERTNPATGEKTVEEATVLSTNSGVVLQFADSIEILGQDGLPERLVFKGIPPNLRAKPTLTTLLMADQAFSGELNLSYLTDGLTWKADYVAGVSPDEKHLDIQAWVTLTNTAGTNFENFTLQLLAGDVNRAMTGEVVRDMYATAAPEAKQQASEETLGDYHLYTIPFKTTLLNNQTKQVSLFSAGSVAMTKRYIYSTPGYTTKGLPVTVFMEFDNTKENGLGLPVPKGIMRLYKEDSSGDAQFIGEDFIGNTPENQTITLEVGNAFDVTVETIKTDRKEEKFYNRDKGETDVAEIETFQLTINNAREVDVVLEVHEDFWGGTEWEITAEDIPHEVLSAQHIVWKVPVEAKTKRVFTFTRRTW